jgi:hypothetical protein
VCVVSEALCSISNGHYTEFGNCSFSDEEIGRLTLTTCVSYLKKREKHRVEYKLFEIFEALRLSWV